MTRKDFEKLKTRDFANGAVRDEISRVFKERDELASQLRIERLCRSSNKNAVVDSVGGLVEGRPTSGINYLQRIQELVQKERHGYVLAMRVLQSDLILDDKELAARDAFLPSSKGGRT